MSPEVHDELLSAVRAGGAFLDRFSNLHGPPDFRGTLGADAWRTAVALGNWAAAARIVRGGYSPPGQEPLAAFLDRFHLVATDFLGEPAHVRLFTHLASLSNSDDPALESFIVELGKPWDPAHLNTALFLAARSKKGTPLIRVLCSAGADIDARWDPTAADLPPEALDIDAGATPLIAAASRPYGGRVEPWIECGADVNAASLEGRTALHWTCRRSDSKAVRALLTAGARVDRPDRHGVRALHEALWSSDGRVLDAVLEAGAAPLEDQSPIADCDPGAVLRLAVRSGVALPATAAGAAKLLATLPSADGTREAQLFRAAAGGYWELVRLLLTAGARPSHNDIAGRNCLHAAAVAASARTITTLVESALDPNARDCEQHTPLMLAGTAGHGARDATTALLAAGADPTLRDAQGQTALDLIASAPAPDPAVARLLLAAGAAPDAPDEDGRTPLHTLLRKEPTLDRLALVDVLLSAGADPNRIVEDVFAPLGLCRSRQALELLLAAGAATSPSESVHHAVLRQAAYGTDDVFTRLLDAIADPCTVKGRGDETLLHRLAWSDTSDGAHRLRAVLARCPDANQRDEVGMTPLHYAARHAGAPAVHALLEAGANPETTDLSGKTAADHARENGRWLLAEIFAP